MPGLSCFDAEAASLTKSVVVILRPPEGMDATLKPLLAELGHLLQGCCDKSPQSLRLQVQARALLRAWCECKQLSLLALGVARGVQVSCASSREVQS